MSRRSVTRRKTMQAAHRVGAYLSLMVVQEDDNGDVLLSLLPLPEGVAMVATWLATMWVTLALLVGRARLEVGWLGQDALNLLDALAMRLHVALAVLDILARATWWAICPAAG